MVAILVATLSASRIGEGAVLFSNIPFATIHPNIVVEKSFFGGGWSWTDFIWLKIWWDLLYFCPTPKCKKDLVLLVGATYLNIIWKWTYISPSTLNLLCFFFKTVRKSCFENVTWLSYLCFQECIQKETLVAFFSESQSGQRSGYIVGKGSAVSKGDLQSSCLEISSSYLLSTIECISASCSHHLRVM